MKAKIITLSIVLVVAISVIVTLSIPKSQVFLGVYGANSEMRRTEMQNKSPYAIFGDNSQTLMTEQERTLKHTLEIENPNNEEKTSKLELNMQTGKVKLFDKKGVFISELLLQPDQLTRFMTIDRYAEKYYEYTPYQYGANNPILNIDVNGDSIWIYYGENQRELYTPGMEYKGDDKFVSTTIGYLNKMNSVKQGDDVLGDLSSSENNFNFKNTPALDSKGNAVDGAAQFVPNSNGGGDIRASVLMGNFGDYGNIATVSHELYHGYTQENGMNPATINGEVEAFLYGFGIAQQLTMPTGIPGFGNETNEGSSYNTAMQNLYIDGYGQANYNAALSNFQNGSSANAAFSNGLRPYRNHKIDPNYKPLIGGFLPFIKF